MSEAPRGGRVPSLDGLRAVAICLVLYSHLSLFQTIRRIDFGIDLVHIGSPLPPGPSLAPRPE